MWRFMDGVSPIDGISDFGRIPVGGSLAPHRASSLRAVGRRQHDGPRAELSVCINDPSVSRGHARITIDDGSAIIEDLSSKNGTQVMG